MTEYVGKEDVMNLFNDSISGVPYNVVRYVADYADKMRKRIQNAQPADVLPYFIESDGTLTITVPKGTKVDRVLVEEDGTHWGGLYYAD